MGEEWNILEYTPLTDNNKKYSAKIKIINIVNTKNDFGEDVKQITTRLTIDPLDIIYGGSYTETTVYETSIGIKSKSVISTTIDNTELSYWLERKNDI